MKRITTLLTLLFCTAALALAQPGTHRGFYTGPGSTPNMKAQVVNLTPFDQVVITGKFIVELVPSFGDRITVGGEDIVLEKVVSVTQKGKKLIVKNRSKHAYNFPPTPMQLEYRDLKLLEIGGATQARFQTLYKGKNITVTVKGESLLLGDMQVEKTANIEIKDKAEIRGSLLTNKGKLVIGPEANNNLRVSAKGKFTKQQK